MNGKFASFAKGMGAGTLIGLAVYAGGSMMMNGGIMNTRSIRKKLSHAAKNAGSIMNNVASMLK